MLLRPSVTGVSGRTIDRQVMFLVVLWNIRRLDTAPTLAGRVIPLFDGVRYKRCCGVDCRHTRALEARLIQVVLCDARPWRHVPILPYVILIS